MFSSSAEGPSCSPASRSFCGVIGRCVAVISFAALLVTPLFSMAFAITTLTRTWSWSAQAGVRVAGLHSSRRDIYATVAPITGCNQTAPLEYLGEVSPALSPNPLLRSRVTNLHRPAASNGGGATECSPCAGFPGMERRCLVIRPARTRTCRAATRRPIDVATLKAMSRSPHLSRSAS